MAYPEIKCVKNTLGGNMQKWEHVDGEKKKNNLRRYLTEYGRKGKMKRNKNNGQLDIFNHEHCATSILYIFIKSVQGCTVQFVMKVTWRDLSAVNQVD